MDHPLEQQLKRVSSKLQQLLKQYQLIRKENEKLKEEIGHKAGQYTAISIQSEKLQQQVEILKLTKSEMNQTEKRAFEKRLDQYIKEIDRCISILNE